MKKTHCAAVDLGATSGRVIVGAYTNESLELTEVHRFPNAFHRLNQHEYWDLGGFFSHIQKGLVEAKKLFPDLASCGVDTWGVDYALLDREGRLVAPVHAYRDERTEPIRDRLIANGEDKQLYNWTGLPPVNYNTVIQLHESLTAFPHLRDAVDRCLLLPDYFNYLLSGEMVNEVSIASTGQLLDIKSGEFSQATLDFFGIPSHWFQGPAKAGQKLGKVRDIPGLENIDVILAPGHDTSCAFEAIPRIGKDLFISAGTWLLTGGLTAQAASGDIAYELGVSNERDGQGGYRPNKILLGLWMLEKVMPSFDGRPTNDAEWSALIELADDISRADVLIDTSDRSLFNPENMKDAIDANLTKRGGKPPADLPGYVSLICDSLGASVADTVTKFETMTGETFDNLIIVGGGSKNRLLCQRIADFAGIPVTSYKLEGTTVGNIGYQLLGLGVIDSLDEFRQVVARDIAKHSYRPSA